LRLHRESNNSGGKGWELIYQEVPFLTKDFEIGCLKNGEVLLLMFNYHQKEIALLNVSNREKKLIPFPQWEANTTYWNEGPINSFVFDKEKFYHSNNKKCWRIDLDGNIEQVDEMVVHIQTKIATKKKENDEAISKYGSGSRSDVFKNLTTVGINSDNKLMFNIHALDFVGKKDIKLNYNHKNKDCDIVANLQSNREFEFEDGSTVEMNRAGFVILKSSDPDIPVMYIPTALDTRLGVATDKEFAGNDYYYNEPLHEVILDDAGLKPLKVVSMVKSYTQFGISYVKYLVDDAPVNLLGRWKEYRAQEIKRELELFGAKGGVIKSNKKLEQLSIISTKGFFEQYINEFVNQIIAHGNKN